MFSVGLKPVSFADLNGPAEAAPFHKPFRSLQHAARVCPSDTPSGAKLTHTIWMTTGSQSSEHSFMSCEDAAFGREVGLETPVVPHMRAAKHDAVAPGKHVEVAGKHDVVHFRLG